MCRGDEISFYAYLTQPPTPQKRETEISWDLLCTYTYPELIGEHE